LVESYSNNLANIPCKAPNKRRRGDTMDKRIKVKLKVDLTQYLNGLVSETEGYTIGNHGIWSRANDNFTGVHFPGVGSLDVLWSSLEIIDQDYLDEMKKLHEQRMKEYRTAREIIKYVGPRGGFKNLSFVYNDSNGINVHYSNGFKQESEKIMDYFNEINLKVEMKIQN
jgi:hypothetical protein